MVRDGERRVAHLRAEVLDEEGRDRAVHHRHVDDLDPDQSDQDRCVRIRLGDEASGVARDVRGVGHGVVDR